MRDRLFVFGSRAVGRACRHSDIDIAIAGEPLRACELAPLSERLEDSDLPYRVDVVNPTEASEDFRAFALAARPARRSTAS